MCNFYAVGCRLSNYQNKGGVTSFWRLFGKVGCFVIERGTFCVDDLLAVAVVLGENVYYCSLCEHLPWFFWHQTALDVFLSFVRHFRVPDSRQLVTKQRQLVTKQVMIKIVAMMRHLVSSTATLLRDENEITRKILVYQVRKYQKLSIDFIGPTSIAINLIQQGGLNGACLVKALCSSIMCVTF